MKAARWAILLQNLAMGWGTRYRPILPLSQTRGRGRESWSCPCPSGRRWALGLGSGWGWARGRSKARARGKVGVQAKSWPLAWSLAWAQTWTLTETKVWGVFLFLALVFFPLVANARGGYYIDLAGHWADKYVRVLWEEEVTEGFPVYYWSYGWGWVMGRSFRPDEQSSRAELVMVMSEAFRLAPLNRPTPTFKDVPRDLLVYGDRPVYPYIEAAVEAGLARGDGMGYFYPGQVVNREQAFALLIRALGLRGHALGLSDEEVQQYLSRFWDRWAIEPSLSRELALAVKLRIVDGYPDGSLQPKRGLTHAEGATILYRSALFLAFANPEVISPDGDNYQDETIFTFQTLKNRNLTGWNLYITDYSGGIVKTFNDLQPWNSRIDSLPPFLRWDGHNDAGVLLSPGNYYYYGWLRDRNGQLFYSVRKPLRLAEFHLWASLTPELVAAGGNLHLQATTAGGARRVTARLTGVGEKELVPAGATDAAVNSWATVWLVPEDWNEGEKVISVEADFGVVRRQVSLPFRVKGAQKGSPQSGGDGGDPLQKLSFVLTD